MKPIAYRTDGGRRTALLIKTGRKFHHIVLMDLPIRVVKVPRSEERHFEDLYLKGNPYPVNRARRLFREAARASYQGNLKNAPKNVREALR